MRRTEQVRRRTGHDGSRRHTGITRVSRWSLALVGTVAVADGHLRNGRQYTPPGGAYATPQADGPRSQAEYCLAGLMPEDVSGCQVPPCDTQN